MTVMPTYTHLGRPDAPIDAQGVVILGPDGSAGAAAPDAGNIVASGGVDMRLFSDITVICDTAPSVAGRVMIGEDGVLANARYVALIDQQGNLTQGTAATVSTAKTSYSLFEGSAYVWIVGATGGTYRLKGSN